MSKITTKIVSALVAASMLIPMQSTAHATDRGHDVKPVSSASKSIAHRGNKSNVALGVALGVGLGVIGLIAANAKDKDSRGDYGHRRISIRDGHAPRGMCRVWREDCRDGSDRACFKYDRHC